VGYGNHTDNYKKHLQPLLKEGYITLTMPESPRSPQQRYIITENGKLILAGRDTE